MIKKVKTPLIVCNIILIFLVLISLFFSYSNSGSGIVYVDTVKLFDGFRMTKELKHSGEKEFNYKKSRLDSLYTKLQSSEILDTEREAQMQEFIQAKEELEQFSQVFAFEQSSKIWVRIKSYSSEFLKENGYQLILGSENQTDVLFADESIDVTDDLLSYINKKYEGLE